MATKKTTKKVTATPAKSGASVTVKDIAEQLKVHPKSLRRKLRSETRAGEHQHKVISRGTRYAFTKQEAAAIVKRFSSKKSA